MIAAVDPGASPTLVTLNAAGELTVADGAELAGMTKNGKTRPIPELCRDALWPDRRLPPPDLVVIEDVAGQPGDSRVAIAVLSNCVGMFIGICVGLGIRYQLVPPSTWKTWAGLRGAPKAASRAAACKRFPAHAALFRLVKHEHRAEAALMAAWARHRG